MSAEKIGPLAVVRNQRQSAVRIPNRLRLLACQRQPEVLVYKKVENDVDPIPLTEIHWRLIWRHVGLCHEDRIAAMPREHLAHRDQVFGMVSERGTVRTFAGNHKWQRVDPESVHAQLQPRFDDPRDLGLNRRIAGVEIGLMIVEAVEVIFAGLFVEGPGSLLYARKSHTLLSIRRFLL